MSEVLPSAWLMQGDATRIPLADASVDMVFTSVTYLDARTYNKLVSGGDAKCKHRKTTPLAGRHWQYHTCNACGGFLEHLNAHRSCEDWVAWMLDVVTELTRVTRGLVLVNCGGVTRDRCYW